MFITRGFLNAKQNVYANEYLISNLYIINMSINDVQQTVKNFKNRLNRFSK